MPVETKEQDGLITVSLDTVEDTLPDRPDEDKERAPDKASIAEKSFVSWMEGKLSRSRDLMKPIHDRWDRYLSIDAGKSPWTGYIHSQIHVPVIKKAKETILKNMRQGLFPSEVDWFDVDPVEQGDEDTAWANKVFLRWQLGQVGFVQRFSDEALDQGATIGTTIVRTMFRRRVRNARRERVELVPLADPATGLESETEFEEQRTIVRQREDHGGICDFRVVPPKSIYPFQTEGIERLRDSPGLIETGVISWADLMARRERVTTLDQEGFRIRRRIGVYKNTDQVKRSRVSTIPSTGIRDESNDEQSISHNATANEVWGYPWREVWFKVPLTDILLSQKQRDGVTPTVEPSALRAFMDKWDVTDSDMEPDGGWWVAEIVDGILVRLERNPAPFEEEGEIPYLNWHYKRRPGHIFGIGIYEQTEKMQTALDAIVSGGLDGTIKNVYPQYVADQTAFEAHEGGPDSIFTYEPYKVSWKMGGRSIKEAVETFAPEGSVLQTAFAGQKQWVEMIRDISGATAELEGVGNAGRKTATEINQVSSAALASVNFLNARAEQTLLGPMLRQFIDYNQAFATPRQVVRVIGEDAQAMFVPVTEGMLRKGRVDVMPKGSSELTSRLVQGQATTNIFSLLEGTGRLKVFNWIKLIIRRMGINEDVKDLAMTDEEFMQLQAQMAQLQAQAAGQDQITAEGSVDGQQIPVGDTLNLLGGGGGIGESLV